MENLLNDLFSGAKGAKVASELADRALGLSLAIVADTNDPMLLGRIQVSLPEKAGRYQSDWLYRLVPWSGSSPQVPQVGETVVIGFLDGNKHKGVYLGILQNLLNPASANDVWTATFAGANITIDAQGAIAITGATSVTINGLEVATVTAKDSRNDTLVNKGWI